MARDPISRSLEAGFEAAWSSQYAKASADCSDSAGRSAIDWSEAPPIGAGDLLARVQQERCSLERLLSTHSQPQLQRIGVWLSDAPANLITGLALMFAGLAQAVLPRTAPRIELERLSTRLRLTHLLVSPEEMPLALEGRLLGHTAEGHGIWRLSSHGMVRSGLNPRLGPIAFLSTSSGTTSQRPAVCLTPLFTQLALHHPANWDPHHLLRRPLLRPGLQNHSGRLFALQLLLRGIPITVRWGVPAPDWFDTGCDGMSVPPLVLQQWLQQDALGLFPAEFLCIAGTDHVPMAMRRRIAMLPSPRLGVCYATSQTGPLTWLPPDRLLEEPESIGWPIPGVSLTPVAPSGPGSINPGACHGLPSQAGLSSPVFHEWMFHKELCFDWPGMAGEESELRRWQFSFNPRDRLARLPSGALRFAGRSDDVFLYAGRLVSPLEIEEELRGYPEVRECVAFGLPHPLYGAIPVAALVLRDGPSDQASIDLVLHRVSVRCRQNLGMVAPRRLCAMAELPRGATGKPLRRVLRERFAQEIGCKPALM